MKRGIAILSVMVTAGICYVFFRDVPEESARDTETKNDAELSDPSIRVITQSLFNAEYAKEGGSIENDLETVLDLLTNCQLIIKNFDSFFLPDNQAVTTFLQGANPDKIAWIPPGHSSVSREGKLVDRNGVPVFFHRESGLRFQLRSAGEDRVMWTSDDVVFPNQEVPSEAN